MILNLTRDALNQAEDDPSSLYYRHPEYRARWWWREFNRISYKGGREYAKPQRLSVDFDYPVLRATPDGQAIARDSEGRPVDPTVMRETYPSMLFRHNREQSWEFKNRRRRAHYHNFVGPTINMLVSHSLKKGITRSGDDKLTQFWKGVDCHRKVGIDTFMREGLRWAQVEGLMYCFLDIDKARSPEAPDADGDGMPYVYWVNPLDIFDWSVDDDGEFIWLKQFIYYEKPRKYNERVQPVHRFRIWTKDDVTEIDVMLDQQTGRSGEQGKPTTTKHAFGRVPCEPLFGAKKDPETTFPDGEPVASDLAKSANAIYNYTSLLDELFYKQTFSQLVVPDPNVDAIEVGTNTVFGFNPMNTGAMPAYISPDAKQPEVLMAGIEQELQRGRQAFGVGRGRQEGSMQKSSADAAEMETEDKRSILADVAAGGSDFESRLVDLFNSARAVGNAPSKDATIQYPTDFDIRAFQDEINEALSLRTVGLSPEIMLEIRKQLATRKLAGLPEDERAKLLDTLTIANDVPTALTTDPAKPNVLIDAQPGAGGAGGQPGGAPGAGAKPEPKTSTAPAPKPGSGAAP